MVDMEHGNSRKALLSLVTSMLIFSTIGIFRRHIQLSSAMISLLRAVIGVLFLLVVLRIGKKRLDCAAIKKNAPMLLLSSGLMGLNWILLFEAYRYTSVATATLCYYMEPIILVLLSPVFLGEKLTRKKMLCVLAALAGMVLVSGVLEVGFTGGAEMKGVLFGLGAAVLYASVILINKRLGGIGAYDRTIMQLGLAALLLLPYTLLTGDFSLSMDMPSAVMMVLVGVVHTGFAYCLYFGSLGNLRAQTVALLSYVDPVVAIILSALLLGERMTMAGVVGAVLVLGATIVSELPEKTKEER